ncbi:hypothetical protein GCM10008025_04880 [Ornithinibacillus halotolerans]|uniref:Uncharacterized protein n=1 Tax=Ornithinibacillus halotolerans TaxID=1274357 RepID=A0A916RPG7_9BACI|nr:hypothetical protein GCM10008025_04880 [Ornithinibacillus halotolerans]
MPVAPRNARQRSLKGVMSARWTKKGTSTVTHKCDECPFHQETHINRHSSLP